MSSIESSNKKSRSSSDSTQGEEPFLFEEMSYENEKSLFIIILGIIDNLHDFYGKKDEEKCIIEGKSNLLWENYRKFYLARIKESNFSIETLQKQFKKQNKEQNYAKYFDWFFNSSNITVPPNVDGQTFKNLFKSLVLSPGTKLSEIDKKIIYNFDYIFNINQIKYCGNELNITNKNINQTISDHQKLLLRQPLYYLIETGKNLTEVFPRYNKTCISNTNMQTNNQVPNQSNANDELINFFIKYLNLDTLDVSTQDFIKSLIKNNIINFVKVKNNIINFVKDGRNENITYPITFMDDMADGLPKKNFRFKILNLDQKLLDEAKVESLPEYFNNFTEGKHSRHLFINNEESTLVLKPSPKEKFLYYPLGIKYYLEESIVRCEFKGINIGVKINSVNGIFNTVLILYQLFEKIFEEIKEIEKQNLNLIQNKEAEIKRLFVNYKNEIKKNIIDKVIVTDNLHEQLYKIYQMFPDDLEMCLGCITFLLFGMKRYGDWIQADIAKKYYFMLQTSDFYCKIYSYVIGGPVIIDDKIYNYEPVNQFSTEISKANILKYISAEVNSTEEETGKKRNRQDIVKSEPQTTTIEPVDTLLYQGLNTVTTGPISRYYFLKYLKYKNKYLKLKKSSRLRI